MNVHPTRRPAETTSLAAAAVILVAKLTGWDVLDDPETMAALIVVVGALPTGVTGLVELRRRG